MWISVTTDNGVLVDRINVEDEIGDLSKPLPAAALLERLRASIGQDDEPTEEDGDRESIAPGDYGYYREPGAKDC